MFPTAEPNGHLQQSKQEHPEGQDAAPIQEIQEIVRQETDGGRRIVRFLVGAMEGQLQDAGPSHRLSAARQLVNLGFTGAQDFIDRNAQHRRRNAPEPRGKTPLAISGKLAQIVREETEDGRVAIRFLVDVMEGTLEGFKPHHRLAAARELLRRGFDNAPGGGQAQPAAARRQQPFDHNSYAPVPVRQEPVDDRREAIDCNDYPVDHRHADEFDDETAPRSSGDSDAQDHDDYPRTAPGFPRRSLAAPVPGTLANRETLPDSPKSDTRNPLRIFF